MEGSKGLHLLISGIPGTGKSTFARWLASEHGYVRCPSGAEPGSTFFSDIDEARRASDKIVIDWGFPVGMLNRVRSLIASGVEPWWFDGDRDAALQSFLARAGHPGRKADWDVQLRNIDEHWAEIAGTFNDRILDVIARGPVHLSNEERWEWIESHRGTSPSGDVEAS